jgi:hypothetical protein
MSARRSVLLAAATLILSVPLTPGETLQNGKHTVDFLGLEKGTAAQIHALLGGREGVTVHYCAADLIAKAGASDAAVFIHPGEMRRRTASADDRRRQGSRRGPKGLAGFRRPAPAREPGALTGCFRRSSGRMMAKP